MVSSGVDGGHAINTSGETARNRSREDTTLSGIVKPLEELEGGGVRRRGLAKRREGLNDNVRVSLDVASATNLLGRGEVVIVGVDEEARVKVRDGHRDSEVRVRGDGVTVLGEGELRRGHVCRRSDDTHRRRVARTRLDLLTVGDRQVGYGETEVDEVVARGERRDLAGSRAIENKMSECNEIAQLK